MIQAEIHTVKGVMKIDFFEKDAPGTVANFVELSNNVRFHRSILP